MTTPPRGEADEPPPIRETGVGWPDQPPPPRSAPPPEPPPQPLPKADPARRSAVSASPDPSFADAVQKYRAGSSYTRPARTYAMAPQRPGTVTAAAVILFVTAGLGLLACCGINGLAGEADLDDSEQTLLLVFSAVLVVAFLLNIVLGSFILRGRQWARVTTIVLCALGILGSVVSLIVSAGGDADSGNGLSTCFGIVVNVVIIILLSGERAGDYFRSVRG